MKTLPLAIATYAFLLKECLNNPILPIEHLCDFALNPHSSIKPVLKESNGQDEVWCSVHNPHLTDYVAMVCPKKTENGDYKELETVPAECFAKHLYSPYDTAENEKDIELLELDKKLSFNKTFTDFVLKVLVIPGYYKHNKTIYCRCDNRKTKKGEDAGKIEEGKVGLVKIVLNKKDNKPRGIDFTESNELEQTDIEQNGNDKIIKVKENDIIHFKFNPNQNVEMKEYENIINMKYGFLQENVLNIRFPTVFLSTINFSMKITENTKPVVNIFMKIQKTESIDGCDFTKPAGEGDYQDGFSLADITSNEKICSVHIGSSQKKIAAGIKCPYKLTPTYCFRHVLYEKNIKGVMSYQPFLLTDILGILDVEFYSNAKEGSYIVGLPVSPQKYSVVRCVCENNGKTGIMELRIDSSSGWAFLSLTLMLLLTALLYAC
ncbi:male fertility protein pf47 [Plasmodium cynomolgi strain B]|uniref:Male fertility protein pf47 n=1 Tax=Plasmodium cynomolgi (strain B) TaxID=1120755 RepID=K6UE23_PLACD|nr:male fertility protein pf47 [Plasmodium cynomolgi strain B]GAB67601.1 male fertility protein pf47 [Plasmodium cynomolgi strain B]